MYELSIKGDFASSHSLRGHSGKCKNLHGHTWKVKVVIEGKQLNDIGMVADFAFIKRHLKIFLSKLDHTHLNDLDFFKKINPTSENLAKYIYDEFSKMCQPLKIREVQVLESDSTSVTYFE